MMVRFDQGADSEACAAVTAGAAGEASSWLEDHVQPRPLHQGKKQPRAVLRGASLSTTPSPPHKLACTYFSNRSLTPARVVQIFESKLFFETSVLRYYCLKHNTSTRSQARPCVALQLRRERWQERGRGLAVPAAVPGGRECELRGSRNRAAGS